jgi:hypothetical protein
MPRPGVLSNAEARRESKVRVRCADQTSANAGRPDDLRQHARRECRDHRPAARGQCHPRAGASPQTPAIG